MQGPVDLSEKQHARVDLDNPGWIALFVTVKSYSGANRTWPPVRIHGTSYIGVVSQLYGLKGLSVHSDCSADN